MRIKLDYAASRAVLTLDEGEVLQEHVLDRCVRYVASDVASIWNVDLEVTPAVASSNIDLLRKLGFLQAGSNSTATQTFVVWRKQLRRSGDGGDQRLFDPNLAVPGPVLAPSNEETRAVTTLHEELDKRFSSDAITRRVAELEAAELLKKLRRSK